VLLLLGAFLLYRGRAPGAEPSSAPSSASPPLRLLDLAPELGLAEMRWSAPLRHARILGTVGGGVAWGDFDGDGWPDLFLTQGVSRLGSPEHPANCGRLLRNEQGRRFRDVTAESGIRACGWGMGALFEDLDGDGNLDLFLTFVGENQLWWNQGDGRFREGAREAGVASAGWHAGAAALDATGDGRLDLYVTRYLDTSPEQEAERPAFELLPIEAYPPREDALFLNVGGRRFEAAPESAIAAPPSRGLGVAAADFGGDGQADLYIANDLQRNTLLRGLGNGTFEDVTDLAGVGVGEQGRPEAGMGIGVGDLTGNGHLDLVVSNFASEPANLFVNHGDLAFTDETRARGLHAPTFQWLGWATELVDLDNSGHLDLYVANGHLVPSWVPRLARLLGGLSSDTASATFGGPFRQPLLVLRGDHGRLAVEPSLASRLGVWRGGAAADFDLDGRVDLFLYSSDRRTPSLLLANRSHAGRWLQVSMRRPGSPPPAAGWRIAVSEPTGAHGERRFTRHRQVISGGSYLSASATPLHIGVGEATSLEVELVRPGRPKRRLEGVPVDRVLVMP
jgi:enediyne biosynthesis protein E4